MLLKALGILLALGGPAFPCTFPSFGDVTVTLRGDRLVATRAGTPFARASLPVLERDWGCRTVHAFPEKGEFYVEWDQGRSGEDVTFNRVSLIAFRIDEALTEQRRWTLYQGYNDDGEELVQISQSYRLVPTPYGARVILIAE